MSFLTGSLLFLHCLPRRLLLLFLLRLLLLLLTRDAHVHNARHSDLDLRSSWAGGRGSNLGRGSSLGRGSDLDRGPSTRWGGANGGGSGRASVGGRGRAGGGASAADEGHTTLLQPASSNTMEEGDKCTGR